MEQEEGQETRKYLCPRKDKAKMIDYSITQDGKPLPKYKYHIDLNNRVLETCERDLVLDFSGKDGWTFITGISCTFLTGDNCDFKTTQEYCEEDFDHLQDSSTFQTGYNCTFKTGSYCTFMTGGMCKFETDRGCTFITRGDCYFNTCNDCTFIVTGINSDKSIFNTGQLCVFNVGYDCIFNTGCECTFSTYGKCYFKTGDRCIFKSMDDNIFECGELCAYSVSHIENNTFLTYDGCSTIFDWYNDKRAILTKDFYELQKVIRG